MVSSPIVSIVITTYNSSQTIIETLNSIFKQTFKEFELLIFDDLSSDNTLDLIDEYLINCTYEFKIKKSIKNSGGPATGRNWGINNSKGKFICFLDADDVWKINKLEKQIKFLENNNFDVLSTNAEVLNSKQFKVFSGELNIFRQIVRNKIILSSSIVKKDFIEKMKINFNESKHYVSVEDYDFFLRILLNNGKIYVLHEKLIIYRVLENSISHIDFISNERKRLKVLTNLKTKNILINALVILINIIYRTKLILWNSK
jgi:teichuronic acid biosynthesis glycosyltransferase TuaG